MRHDPILRPLCESLLHLLDLRFVFARLHPTASGAAPVDHLSIDKRYRARLGRMNLPVALEPWLSGVPTSDLSPKQLRSGAETVAVTALSFRSKSIPGTLILGATGSSHPAAQSGSDFIGLAHASRVLHGFISPETPGSGGPRRYGQNGLGGGHPPPPATPSSAGNPQPT